MADRDDSLMSEALFYRGGTEGPRRNLAELPIPARIAGGGKGAYRANPSLIRAVNVAMTLRMPLLLAGEPGVGKTELAEALCFDLDLDPKTSLIRLTVTSDASKETILYRFDELGRLRDAYRHVRDAASSQTPSAELLPTASSPSPPASYSSPAVTQDLPSQTRNAEFLPTASSPSPPAGYSIPPVTQDLPVSAYIAFVGLGRAILEAGGPEAPLDRLETVGRGTRFDDQLERFQDLVEDPLPKHPNPPIVLIDEIDKAPRDLPNDLLTELDLMQFDIPQLGVRVRLEDPTRWPIVIITTNSERSLPDAFLRRCVFHHIDFPPREARFPGDVTIGEIVRARLSDIRITDSLFDDALTLVEALRSQSKLSKRPATAEVLAWVRQMLDPTRSGWPLPSRLREVAQGQLEASLGILLKTSSDIEVGRSVLREWLTQRTT